MSGQNYILRRTGLDAPILLDTLELCGIIRAFERPVGMTLADFRGIPPADLEDVLGPPAAIARNMFTNAYWAAVLTHLGNGTPAPPWAQFLALGTGALPAQGVQRTDTALVTESIRKGIIGASTPSGDPVSAVFSFFSPAADATVAITYTEAGLVSASSGGTLITHAAFPYARSANVDLTCTYTVPRSTT
jgi:hypothetical protein